MWEIVNNETKKISHRGEQNSVLRLDNRNVKDPWHLANCFENYFVTIVDNMLNNMSQLKSNQTQSFRCPPIDERELIRILNSLTNKWWV